MIGKKMVDALNDQINAEIYSAYLYMAMSSWAANAGMAGAAKWFFGQAQEEMTHALKFYNYIQSQGERGVMLAIEQPPADYDSLLHAFEETLAHEQKVTARINALADLAIEEKDHATSIMLQWFVSEQVEEEESVNEIIDKLKLAGADGSGLYMIDKELGARVFTAPAGGEE
ncbi:ferritin [bacterium E08(2017)]|nr:ferritin [bacterium E08(2017)]